MKIHTLSFPAKKKLQNFWKDAWKIMEKGIVVVKYPDSLTVNHQLSWEEWDASINKMRGFNDKLLNSIHKKAGVYGIFTRKSPKSKWVVKYIGHTTYAKQRIANHLFTKHERTDAKLPEVKSAIKNGQDIGISFVEIKPAELRRYVEMMIIAHLQPDWCRHGRSNEDYPTDNSTKKKIVLIACSQSQLPSRAAVKDLFISPLFRYNLQYAERLNPDLVFILSAKYGLLELDEVIDPYDVAIAKKTPHDEQVTWSNGVLKQLKEQCSLKNDEFVFLAGDNYRKHLLPHIDTYTVPMTGLRIGEMLKYLKNELVDTQ